MVGCNGTGQAFAKEPEHGAAAARSSHPFTDVSKKDWYYDSVMYALRNGLFMGTSYTAFSPDGTMTRAMFVTVLGRIAEIDSGEYDKDSEFTDVVAGSYYEPYVRLAT